MERASRPAERAGRRRGRPPAERAAHRPRPPPVSAAPCLRALADGVAITVAATLATAPLLAYHFGSVPLAGLPANLLALPAVAPAMWLGMLKTALGQLSPPLVPSPAARLAHAAATALGGVASLPVGYLAGLGERFADMPGGRLSLPLDSAAAVLVAYAALAVLARSASRATRPLRDRLPLWGSAWRGLPGARRRAIAAALAAALIAAISALLSRPRPPRDLTVRFLDVGQGDAVLIQHPDGTAVLFDGGPPEGGVVRLLRRAGVTRLALVVATHASRDHHGGLPAVLRRFHGRHPARRRRRHAKTPRSARSCASRTSAASAACAPSRLRPSRSPAATCASACCRPPPRPPGPAPEDPNPQGGGGHRQLAAAST